MNEYEALLDLGETLKQAQHRSRWEEPMPECQMCHKQTIDMNGNFCFDCLAQMDEEDFFDGEEY